MDFEDTILIFETGAEGKIEVKRQEARKVPATNKGYRLVCLGGPVRPCRRLSTNSYVNSRDKKIQLGPRSHDATRKDHPTATFLRIFAATTILSFQATRRDIYRDLDSPFVPQTIRSIAFAAVDGNFFSRLLGGVKRMMLVLPFLCLFG